MISEGKKKKFRFVLITGLAVFFLVIVVIPVSASLRVIDPGSAVFIGENNLNINNAPFASAGNSSQNSTQIGWWASAAAMSLCNPSKTVDVTNSLNSFFVSPAEFGQYTGMWYHINTDNSCPVAAAFNVLDPALDIKIWDLDANSDLTGQSVPPEGARLTFRVDTNQYSAAARPDAIPSADGYITIFVKNENGVLYGHLYKTMADQNTLTSQFVNSAPWSWSGTTGSTYWATDLYPAGTYTVYAVSSLNNMRDNYKYQGADYAGKTISPTHTITLTTPPGGETCPGCKIASAVTPSPPPKNITFIKCPDPDCYCKTPSEAGTLGCAACPGVTAECGSPDVKMFCYQIPVNRTCPVGCSCLYPSEATGLGYKEFCNGIQKQCNSGNSKAKYCYYNGTEQTPHVLATATSPIETTTTSSVEQLLQEQNKKLDEQNQLIAEQNKKLAEQSGLLDQILNYFKGIFGRK